MAQKKLYRDKKNGKVSGVAAGMADYFDMDVTVLRVLWVLFIIFTGIFPGLIGYIIATAIIPEKPAGKAA